MPPREHEQDPIRRIAKHLGIEPSPSTKGIKLIPSTKGIKPNLSIKVKATIHQIDKEAYYNLPTNTISKNDRMTLILDEWPKRRVPQVARGRKLDTITTPQERTSTHILRLGRRKDINLRRDLAPGEFSFYEIYPEHVGNPDAVETAANIEASMISKLGRLLGRKPTPMSDKVLIIKINGLGEFALFRR